MFHFVGKTRRRNGGRNGVEDGEEGKTNSLSSFGAVMEFLFALGLFPFVSRVLVFQGNTQNNLFDINIVQWREYVYICLAHKTVVLNFLFKSLSQSLLSCLL